MSNKCDSRSSEVDNEDALTLECSRPNKERHTLCSGYSKLKLLKDENMGSAKQEVAGSKERRPGMEMSLILTADVSLIRWHDVLR